MSGVLDWTVYYNRFRREYKAETLDYKAEGWNRRSRVGFSYNQAKSLAEGMAKNHRLKRQLKTKFYTKVEETEDGYRIVDTRIRIREGG